MVNEMVRADMIPSLTATAQIATDGPHVASENSVAQIAADRETRTSLSRNLPRCAVAATIAGARQHLQFVDENQIR